MTDFGGLMRFQVNGSPLTVRGKVSVNPSNLAATAIANNDGSTSRSLEPKGYRAKVTFEDSQAGSATGQDWAVILLGGPYNLSLIEDTTGLTHTWTGARFTGDPEVDRMNGEVTGLEILSPAYARI